MYVENDFLLALAKPDDWLQDRALAVLAERDDVYTSLAAYAEFLVLTYDPDETTYTVDVERAIADLVDLVPVRPEVHEQAVLTAAVLADEQGFTPFDAIHAGVAIANGDSICSSDRAYDTVEIDRVALEPNGE